ncbi:hypothetical protein ABIE26_001578 [Pedobacter africanus]|uniref:Uncharacterized protein n=1 Tax=Pedobacter africanus TaxID=151894 RepID=A0ACC6KRZ9_9SPHI|nr:immunity 26/phosphotriesterase HocA family protein [Pedobacter africanus]MDR6781934.1 hypothetical protein [Pedobacter africanus]
MFELSNDQRKSFGLNPIESHWDSVTLYTSSDGEHVILYFEGDTIKRKIQSGSSSYTESHYDELTRDRAILLPKTGKGKEKKLSVSVLEQRQPTGVYLDISDGHLLIGNYSTQTTFYSSRWDNETSSKKPIPEIVQDFINQSPDCHFEELDRFKNSKRQNIKFRSGDYFCFKLDRTNYGFGRVLLDVHKIRKKGLIPEHHGLGMLMGPPVIVELFVYKSASKYVDINILAQQPTLPSDVMMDNLLLYGEFEIIGHRNMEDQEFSFPISYGRSIDQRRVVFLQWGLIHLELPREKFDKYTSTDEIQIEHNPYGYYSIGFRPCYYSIDILKALANGGSFSFDDAGHYKAKWDLRNPKNKQVKNEIFKFFGLQPDRSYVENSKLVKAVLPSEMSKQL